MAKQQTQSLEIESIEKPIKKQSANKSIFAGAKSMASTILWISLVVCILNIGVIIITVVGKDHWEHQPVITDVLYVDIPPWYYIFQPIIGGISLFLLSGLSILVFPLNKTLKLEGARTVGTWVWGLVIWIFSVFYIGMFFFDIIAPIINLLLACKVDLGPIKALDQKAINICNTVMGCIPLVTILAAGILYGRVKNTYKRKQSK